MIFVKKISASIATGVLAIGIMGVTSSSASAAQDTVSDIAQTSLEQRSKVKVETQTIGGKEYSIQWNTVDDSIKIFDEERELLGATRMSEVRAQYK